MAVSGGLEIQSLGEKVRAAVYQHSGNASVHTTPRRLPYREFVGSGGKGGRTFYLSSGRDHKLSKASQTGLRSLSFSYKGCLGLTGWRVCHLILATQ